MKLILKMIHVTFRVFIIPTEAHVFFENMFFSFSKTQTLTNINQSVLMTLFLSCVADWCIKLSPMSLAGILKLRDKHLLIRHIVFRKRPSTKTSQELYFTLLGCLGFCSTRVYTYLCWKNLIKNQYVILLCISCLTVALINLVDGGTIYSTQNTQNMSFLWY